MLGWGLYICTQPSYLVANLFCPLVLHISPVADKLLICYCTSVARSGRVLETVRTILLHLRQQLEPPGFSTPLVVKLEPECGEALRRVARQENFFSDFSRYTANRQIFCGHHSLGNLYSPLLWNRTLSTPKSVFHCGGIILKGEKGQGHNASQLVI